MKFLYVLLLFTSSQACADACSKESKLFLELVAVKFAVLANIQKTPENHTEAKWRYINTLGQDIFKKAKLDDAKATAISKLLADNDFSSKPEVEINIFEDYWLLSCKNQLKGVPSTPLHQIAKDALVKCWDAAAARKEFQVCLAPRVNPK